MDKKVYQSYVAILKHELVPALGCTEPIAIAFAAAKVRDVLGCMPEHLTAYLSGNIIKNVKSVTVPNSGGQHGIEVAATLGCVGGDAKLNFEVLQCVTEEDIARTRELVKNGFCKVEFAPGYDNIYIRIEAVAGDQTATVTVEREHTNITYISRNGEVVFSADNKPAAAEGEVVVDKTTLNMKDIYTFAKEADLSEIRDILQRQIDMNSAISAEGLTNNWGECVGKMLMATDAENPEGRAAARAAAGSDARMNGCSMPVVINSGSGNQGITICLPIVEFAKEWNKDEETTLRALCLADLIAVHIKRHIGNLSAFCGAVSAGSASACGVAFMDGCSFEQICMTITNALANVGGMVCDGAKSSCAAKIASSVHAGLMGWKMAKAGNAFHYGEGLVGEDIEATIRNVGRMGRVGMKSTDEEILNIMVGN